MRAVVFDFGGVLFQWRPLQLLRQTVPDLAPDDEAARALATQLFESFTPDSDWAHFDLGAVREAELAQRIATRIGVRPEQVRRVIDAIPPHLVPQADVVTLFHRLKAAGHRLFYLSNMPAPFADHLERCNAFVADFDGGLFSGRVGLMKPQPAMFALALQRFGVDPAQTLFIDDHPGNVEAAQRLGWQALLYTDAAALQSQLRQQGWLA